MSDFIIIIIIIIIRDFSFKHMISFSTDVYEVDRKFHTKHMQTYNRCKYILCFYCTREEREVGEICLRLLISLTKIRFIQTKQKDKSVTVDHSLK